MTDKSIIGEIAEECSIGRAERDIGTGTFDRARAGVRAGVERLELDRWDVAELDAAVEDLDYLTDHFPWRMRRTVPKRILNRWRLAIRLFPLLLAVAALKLAFSGLGLDDAELSPLFTGLVAGTIFLLGFLLAGTLADYKESEKLPGDLAASLEAISDECLILYEDKGASAAQECLAHMQRLAASIEAWLRNRKPTDVVLEEISGLNRHFLAFESLTQPNFIVRLKQEQSAIRRMVIRINAIRETSFVMAGYAIAELTSLLLVGGLLFTEIGQLGIEVFLVSTIAFVVGYMLLLIRDLDNPFDYDGAGQAGAAEVSLAPLEHVRTRLENEVAGIVRSEPTAV